jgi:short subunit fatty acids transporter
MRDGGWEVLVFGFGVILVLIIGATIATRGC